MSVECADGNNSSCTISIVCYSEENEYCQYDDIVTTNGLYGHRNFISSYQSNLSNISISTFDILNDQCNSDIVSNNVIECDASDECKNTIIDGTISNPHSRICCSGDTACASCLTILTLNNSIRCDGYFACTQSGISTSGDDILVAGRNGADSSTITSDKSSNVYCTAVQSCSATTITNVNNLYALAKQSVYQAVKIENVTNIWAYGSLSLFEATIINSDTLYAYGYLSMMDCNVNTVNKIVVRSQQGFAGSTVEYLTGSIDAYMVSLFIIVASNKDNEP